MHVAIKEQEKIAVYLERQAQIKAEAKVWALIFDEALTAVLAE